MKSCFYAILIFFFSMAPAFATVSVSTPTSGDTVSSPVQFIATATTGCSHGVASMGIYVDNVRQYVTSGSSLNTSLPISSGAHYVTVQEWDNCSGSTKASRTINVTGQSGVFVTSPTNNSNVSSSVNYAATATAGSCPQGVAAMGVYVDNAREYTVSGSKLNTQLSMSTGTHNTTVTAWDNCGGASTAAVKVNVQAPSGNVFSGLQAAPGWLEWGELPPGYAICTSCSGVNWAKYPHQTSPSLSGNSTKFNIGGSKPYSDVLWDLKLIGVGSALNLPDTSHTLLPTLHNFTYDADIYITNASVTQALEVDIDMYLNGAGMIWGLECDHLNTGNWDLWDNKNARWVVTDIACPVTNGWHHLTLKGQRQSNNDLLYQSLTWGGVTYNLNKTYAPFSVPSNWYGLTIKYQMDGNHNQASYTTYVDNLNLTYQ